MHNFEINTAPYRLIVRTLLVERGWHEPILFFLVHLRDIPRGDALSAVRAEYRAVVLREVDRPFDDAVVEHLDKVTLADLLIVGDEAFAIGAAYFQDMAAPDLFAVRVFDYIHTHHN